jgi:uncharacterized protein (TIGR03083 family)
MDVGTHLDHLAAEGSVLAEAAARAGWDAPVAACDWNVRQLVTHVGGIHRWAAAIVANASPTSDERTGISVGTGPADDELLDWYSSGHARLLETLRAAPVDLDCFAFLPAPSARAFWVRRQAHETAIHRADAESAIGAITPFATEFAQDGIAEMLLGFAARMRKTIETAGTLALHPSDVDASWLVTVGGPSIVAVEANSDADVAVAGTSSDLYLWLWNRPAAVTVTGDETLAELWRKVRVRWS